VKPSHPHHHTADIPRIEWIAALHVGMMVLLATWALGGNVRWAQDSLTGLGLAGLLITATEAWNRRSLGKSAYSAFLWLAPLALLNVLVVVSTLRPSYRAALIESATVYFPLRGGPELLSTARPDLSWRALLLFDALFIPAFNLVLAVRSRTTLRRLFYAFEINASVLAVLGTLQKLSHARGLFFGEVRSPNATFFSTFIYHNHWGAFALLSVAVTTGVIFYSASHSRYRNFFHSPAFVATVALIGLALTIPLSTSRSCTALVTLFLAGVMMHALLRLRSAARNSPRHTWGTTSAVLTLFAVLLGGGYLFAKPFLAPRIQQTRTQLEQIRTTGSVGSRAQLYRETWSMAADRLAFGWGLGSYGTVFPQYNTQSGVEGLPQHYEDAHSDWLQSLAELGLVGSACRACLILLPLLSLRRVTPLQPIALYPLLGCATILGYAWVEFPFGNVAVVLCFWVLLFAAVRLAHLDAREREAQA
jgi:O-antigen ligase